MDCPKCIGKLQEKTIVAHQMHENKQLQGAGLSFDLELNQCFVCGGVWFDKGELQKYMSEGFTALDAPGIGSGLDDKFDKKKGKCPLCQHEMAQATLPEIPQIQIDTCQKCGGLWLDSTEIDHAEAVAAKSATMGAISKFFSTLLSLRKKNRS